MFVALCNVENALGSANAAAATGYAAEGFMSDSSLRRRRRRRRAAVAHYCESGKSKMHKFPHIPKYYNAPPPPPPPPYFTPHSARQLRSFANISLSSFSLLRAAHDVITA